MNKPFFNLVALQFKEFFREPEIIFWAFVLPIVLSWILGVAIGSGGGSRGSIALIETADATKTYWSSWIEGVEGASAGDRRIDFRMLGREEAILAIKKGEISLFIEKVPGADSVRFFLDPRSEEAQMTYLAIERYLRESEGERRADSDVVPLNVQGTRYVGFLVPGLLAMDVMSSALWGIGWALIEIRIKKLLRRMAATPMHKSMFLASHFFTRLIVNTIEFVALFVFVHLYFGVGIQGSVGALIAVFIAGNMAFSGLSILMSSRTANPRVGNGLINAVTFPMTLLSGVFFSYHHLPEWAIPIVQKLPLTMLADSIRSIFNEGAGFAEIAVPAFMLASMGAVFFYAGMRIYKWY
ncbi:MAG: ABC transporter permease [Candidatus Krumholzibacteria bacterium]|nr:ABC transporter permease [Candidatus Krumholzibacteria bacterium]